MKYKLLDYVNVRPIKGYYYRYWISKAGRVYDICKQRKLTEYLHEWGYPAVIIETPRLHPGFEHKAYRDHCFIHQYVAEAFLPRYREQYQTVNHKDCDKKNYHYFNLEFVTRSENYQHAKVMGRFGVQGYKGDFSAYASYSIETGHKYPVLPYDDIQ